MKIISILCPSSWTVKNLLCLAFACLLLLGCSSTTQVPDIVEATLTPIPTKTNTSSPTATMTATATLISSETPTPLPTLVPEQAQEALKELLWDNTSCLAPCLIGIIPGKTTLNEISTLFTHLGKEMYYTSEGGQEFYNVMHRFNSGLSIYISTVVQSEIAESLNILITPPENQSASVRREWSTYSPDTLINQYGLPSKVEFFADRGPTPSYAMDMYFDTADLIVEYYSHDLRSNSQICPPTDRLDYISIWSGENPVNPPFKEIPLEDATQMSMEDFSKLMTGNPSKACLNLKEGMFP